MQRAGVGWMGVAAAALGALAAAAQQAPPGPVARVYVMKVKPGMEKQFEAGRRRHVAWHQKQKDTWGWYAGQIVAGEREGQYVFGTFGHQWADFDLPAAFEAGDDADFNATMAPYIESSSNAFYLFLPALSRPAAAEAPFYDLTYYEVEFGALADFQAALEKVHEAIGKTNWVEAYEFYGLYLGGEHPTFVQVVPRQNWAAFAPPAVPFARMLEQAFGREDAAAIQRGMAKSVRRVRSEVVRTRPELGYSTPPP